MALRKELGEQFQKDTGVKLVFMSFFAKAAANARGLVTIALTGRDGGQVERVENGAVAFRE